MTFLDRTGQKFGMLTVVGFSHKQFRSKRLGSYIFWKCQCDCGNEATVLSSNLTKGNTKSCGCQSSRKTIGQRASKHMMTDTPEYNSWRAMKDRCYCKSHSEYKRYGARGIEVCDSWKNSFEKFFQDMGPKPTGFSLERIDYDKGYSPSNCKWASSNEQANNKRINLKINFEGNVFTLAELAKEKNIPYARLYKRIKSGWSIEKAIRS